MSSSSTKTSTPSKTSAATLAAWGAQALPASRTPSPPAGYVPPPAAEMLGSHPRHAEVALAPSVVEELRRFADYDAVFGSAVPPADVMATLLELARQWRTERDAAAAWNTYIRAQDGVAWKVALDLLDELKPAFQRVVAKNPAVKSAYPRLTEFFGAHKEIAQKATETKKKKAAYDALATTSEGPPVETEEKPNP